MISLYAVEHVVHFSGWIFACLCSLYKLFLAQTDIIENNKYLKYSLNDLKPGWKFVSRLKDESDIEWSTWKYLIQSIWIYLLGQFVVSEIIRRNANNKLLLKYWYIISSVTCITFYLGITHLFIVIIQPLLYIFTLKFGGKRPSIWLLSLLLLASYNYMKYKFSFWQILDSEDLQDEEVFTVLFGVAWTELRCITYCLDVINEKENFKDEKYKEYDHNTTITDVVDMLSYVLYLPVLFTGPIILYEDFRKSFEAHNGPVLSRLKIFVLDIVLYQVYSFLLDLSLHYIYFYAMQSNMEAIYKLPTVGICAAGLWMGLEFHMKYVVSYGMMGAYSRLDNIDPPPTPRCIARIHIYSHMWRYFDVGLYKFLVKYIYKPVFKQLSSIESKLRKKLLSSLVTFLFIYLWHGTQWDIFVWSALNYLGILLEYFGKSIATTEKYKWFKQTILRTDAMETRMVAGLCVPLLMLSAISNTYLFGSTEVGNLFFKTLFIATWYEWFLIYISFYCCCQCSIALQDVPSRTDRKCIEKTA